MSRKTTLLMLAVVLALSATVWWQTRREEGGLEVYHEMLFEGVAPARITAIRVDNLYRSLHLTLERDGLQNWKLTDPIEYPADTATAMRLMEHVRSGIGDIVPAEELAFLEPGLDPPQAVMEVIETLNDGREIRTRIEMGTIDLDGDRVFVRRDGRIFRTLRTLDTDLQRPLSDYRSKRIFDLRPREVVEVHREGSRVFPDAVDGPRARDLGLQLQRRGYGWWMSRPWHVQVQSETVAVFVRNSVSAHVSYFEKDAPTDLSVYGLDPPDIRLSVVGRDGERQTALFGTRTGSVWYCKREDLPYVWRIEDTTVFKVSMPAEVLFDTQIVRVLRRDVTEIQLVSEEHEIRLQRDGEAWSVTEREGLEAPWTDPVPADQGVVGVLLSTLETNGIAKYLPDDAVEDHFPDGAQRRGIWIEARGARQGGWVGMEYRSAAGSRAFTFLRDGENVVCLVPAPIEALLDFTLLDLRSDQLLDLKEIELSSMTFRLGDIERRFVRSQASIWKYPDMDAEALELRPVLDKLFFLRAASHVAAAEAEPLLDPVEVTFEGPGRIFHATIGRTSADRVEAQVLGMRSVLANQDLHAELLAILGR